MHAFITHFPQYHPSPKPDHPSHDHVSTRNAEPPHNPHRHSTRVQPRNGTHPCPHSRRRRHQHFPRAHKELTNPLRPNHHTPCTPRTGRTPLQAKTTAHPQLAMTPSPPNHPRHTTRHVGHPEGHDGAQQPQRRLVRAGAQGPNTRLGERPDDRRDNLAGASGGCEVEAHGPFHRIARRATSRLAITPRPPSIRGKLR